MEDARRRSSGSAASRRLRCLLALARGYLKYLFMKRRRLMHRVVRRTLALLHHRGHHGERSSKRRQPWPTRRALMEREFSCADSPSPAFLAAKRLLLRSRLRGGAVSSCFGSFGAPCGWDEAAAAAPAEAEAEVEEDQMETEDEEEDDDQVMLMAEDGWCELVDVDDRAEEFINMFYEQLRAQSFAAAVFQCSP